MGQLLSLSVHSHEQLKPRPVGRRRCGCLPSRAAGQPASWCHLNAPLLTWLQTASQRAVCKTVQLVITERYKDCYLSH